MRTLTASCNFIENRISRVDCRWSAPNRRHRMHRCRRTFDGEVHMNEQQKRKHKSSEPCIWTVSY
jgi:hypothetical protein